MVIEENEEVNITTEVKAEYDTNNEIIDNNYKSIDAFNVKYISINKTANRNEASPGDEIEYNIKIKTSEYYSYSNIKIIDQIPDGLEFISLNISPSINNREVTWSIDSINENSEFIITYLVKVLPTYSNENNILSNDNLKNSVSLKGEWKSVVEDRVEESEEKDSKHISTPKLKVETKVWNPRQNNWTDSILIGKGYGSVIRTVLTIPEKVDTKSLELKFFYPDYLQINPNDIEVTIEGSTSEYEIIRNTEGGVLYWT